MLRPLTCSLLAVALAISGLAQWHGTVAILLFGERLIEIGENGGNLDNKLLTVVLLPQSRAGSTDLGLLESSRDVVLVLTGELESLIDDFRS